MGATARIAPWLAPIPTAYLIGSATEEHLDWPWPIAGAAAVAVELLGISITTTALELWQHNQTKRKSDPTAPTWLSAILVGVYLVVAVTLTVMLDVIPDLKKWAPAIFPMLSLTGVGNGD